MEFLVDVLDVEVHGVGAHAHGLGDLLVEPAVEQVVKHLLFTRGEIGVFWAEFDWPGDGHRVLEGLDHQACDLAGRRRGAVDHILGGAPAYGDVKQLKVEYVFNGKPVTATAPLRMADRMETLAIAGNANVTAAKGISGGSTVWGINLDGGTLTTKGIDYGPHSFSGTTNIKFNGTLIKAKQDNASLITASTGLDFAPDIQAGGAKIDSNG